MTRSLEIASGRLSPESISGGPLCGFRNKIINGDFDIWQRATSQTASTYGSSDRYFHAHNVSTKTVSRQEFTKGQTDVPGSPKYFCRTVVTTGSGASHTTLLTQPIEGLENVSGKTLTVTFYAKADATKDIAVEFEQNFGSGGSPSSNVNGIGVTTCNLTSSWQKFSFTVDVPSVVGKTFGTTGNDHLSFVIWFDGGSDFDARTNSLGNQSGTFDIAHISIVEGDATGEDDPFEPRHINQERDLCNRYCQIVGRGWTGRWNSATVSEVFGSLYPMRANPSVSFYTTSATIFRVGLSAEIATGLSFDGLNITSTGGHATIRNTNTTAPNAGDFAGLMTDCILLQAEL